MNVDSVSPLKKDGTPKRKVGRPSNAEKPLGKASLTKYARTLGNVTDEALEFIINVLRDEGASKQDRYKAATWIVGTTQALIQQVDRQTLMKKNLEMIDAKLEAAGNIEKPADEADDDLTSTATVFTLDIVK